jgi:2-polyprenyl-6-methoxyphenol hydroxylase-like FAD-dependent oxidoreductase
MLSAMTSRGHAVVLGGSIAGLLAARVLTDHFDRVTLVERDALAHDNEPRKGVPQGRHGHVLLMAGYHVIRHLFPDLVASVDAAGVEVNVGRDVRWHHFGAFKTSFDSAIGSAVVSRTFLEREVARRVAAMAKVEVLDGHDVLGLVGGTDAAMATGARVTGARVRARAEGAPERTLDAELVVDATGRGSRSATWLRELGYGSPPESRIDIDVAYASRVMTGVKAEGWKLLMVVARPPGTRLGVVFPMEEGRFMVTLAGCIGDHPPADDAGWLEFAASLPVDDVHRAVREAEPVTPVTMHKFPANVRRHYELLEPAPGAYVVAGDALCSFNPIYGQGMSVAALEASALGEALRSNRGEGFAARAQKAIARTVDVPWALATGEDLRFPSVRGARGAALRFGHWYGARMHERSAHDAVVAEAFYQVVHMLKKPPSLFHPRVAWRVLAGRQP